MFESSMFFPPNLANWYVGTKVFGYKDRKKMFNPSGLDTGKLVNYYSLLFNNLEIGPT